VRLLTIAVLLLALAGAGCGDDEGGSISSEDCQELIAASTQLSKALVAAQTAQDIDETSAFLEGLDDEAPEEIRADVQVLAGAHAAYAEAIGDVGLAAGETPDAEELARLQEAFSSINQPEVAAASMRISSWANENC
jgi:cell fate (sporulation/competence/biofilm development) regulator YlbF (YheA/YmcA/DUF963 family)